MDAVYFLKHGRFDDAEIRFSLRSLEQHAPFIRKVWVFGDRPHFLTHDASVAEHIRHDYITRATGHRSPLSNFFEMLYCASLIPELSDEFLWFCDDFIILRELAEAEARRLLILGDLGQVTDRGTGLWKESLWRTYDLLKRLGFPAHNFETHTPTYYRRRWIFEAYAEFRDFTTSDRWFGMLGPTAVLNHAKKRNGFDVYRLADEDCRAGFYEEEPAYEDVVREAANRTFLNFDDDAFGDAILRFLSERFPNRSRFETDDASDQELLRFGWPTDVDQDVANRVARQTARLYPKAIIADRGELPELLNSLQLTGAGACVGVRKGEFAEMLLKRWKGDVLHCVDPWIDLTDDQRHIDKFNVPQDVLDQFHDLAQQRLEYYSDRVRIYRTDPEEAVGGFAGSSLDFVYVNHLHYRDALMSELDRWSSRIRSGGILAGHDYLDGTLPSGVFEVKSTVDEWAASRGLTVMCSGEPVWRSWMIRLP